MLRLEDIHVHRGRTHVLKGLTLAVGRGEIVALIGANGAGKTTTLRTVSGLIRPTSGRVVYQPEPGGPQVDLSRLAPEKIVAAGISHCPEGRQVFSSLSVRENLMVGSYLRRDKEGISRDIERSFELFPFLRERAHQAAGSLSGGEQMMLAIARALMNRPRLLILDEPSLGLAPLIVARIFALIAELNAAGTTVFLVEQNAVMALGLAHRAYVLELGAIVLSGTGRELAENPEVRRAYLGSAA